MENLKFRITTINKYMNKYICKYLTHVESNNTCIQFHFHIPIYLAFDSNYITRQATHYISLHHTPSHHADPTGRRVPST